MSSLKSIVLLHLGQWLKPTGILTEFLQCGHSTSYFSLLIACMALDLMVFSKSRLNLRISDLLARSYFLLIRHTPFNKTLPFVEGENKEGSEKMETKLVSVKQAAKMFNFPLQKLYQLVEKKQVPYIELENLSGSISNKINTRTFAEWLDRMAQENKCI